MSLSMYAASVPVFRQILGSLAAILEKAESHADLKKIEQDALLRARLYPDMFPLLRQVQVAADFAKGTVARLAGVEAPRHEDKETDFAGLRERIGKTLDFIDGVAREDIDAGDVRQITVGLGANQRQFDNGQVYLLHYALPNFYFHATTAYAILRHNGLDVGKKDFIGSY